MYGVVSELVEVVEVAPPLEQEGVADKLEPWGKDQGLVFEHQLQISLTDVLVVLDLIVVCVDGEVLGGSEDQDVVYLVLTPLAVGAAAALVVDTGKVLDVFDGDLVDRHTKLVLELALGGPFGTHNARREVCGLVAVLGTNPELVTEAERVRAACVGPHAGERDLLVRPLLQEQPVVAIEHEKRERPVQQPIFDVFHDVAQLLGPSPHRLVLVVQNNAELVHELDLLLIMALEERILVVVIAVAPL